MHELPDPHLFTSPGMRAALARRDITEVYKLLKRAGIAQRSIAAATGQSQSEVSEIFKGRRVIGYDVLVRICEGLGISRGMMGLAYDGAAEPASAPGEEVDEDMRRRVLLAKGSVALFGAPVLGELLHIPERPPTPSPLPTRVTSSDVDAMKNLTRELRDGARTYGGGADVVSTVAARSRVLMDVPADDDVSARLASALAELHVVAGWCCADSGYYDHARANFADAMELASQDPEQMASAFRHAGIQMVDAGAFNDGLKAFQLGLMSASGPEAVAWMHAETALPLAAMGERDAALSAVSRAREQSLSDPFDMAGLARQVASLQA
jgi:transcriptional regulator with XRE-family HTH domain